MNLGALTKFLPWYGWAVLAGGAALLLFGGVAEGTSWSSEASGPLPPAPPSPGGGGGAPRPPGLAPVLKSGSSGPWVSYLQSQLGVEPTGNFDAATILAVKAYQAKQNLGVDGVVGSGTWGSLGVTAAPPAPPPTPVQPPKPDDGSGWNEPGKDQDKPSGTDSSESTVADMGLLGALMVGVKQSNIEMSTALNIPDYYAETLKKYAASNPADGKMLLEALARNPKFREGGWILDVQRGAAAITINDTIFFKAGAINNMENYIHELVHVYQGGHEDPATFFVNYFGQSALEIWKRLIAGQALDVMKSNPDEMQAYAVGERFQAWMQAGAK